MSAIRSRSAHSIVRRGAASLPPSATTGRTAQARAGNLNERVAPDTERACFIDVGNSPGLGQLQEKHPSQRIGVGGIVARWQDESRWTADPRRILVQQIHGAEAHGQTLENC